MEGPQETHKLRNYYRFWRSIDYYQAVSQIVDILTQHSEYLNQLEELGLCKTVEDFWQLYLSLPIYNPEGNVHYYLFKVFGWLVLDYCQNSIKPIWEHKQNAEGGRIITMVLRRDLVPYLWEILVSVVRYVYVSFSLLLESSLMLGTKFVGCLVHSSEINVYLWFGIKLRQTNMLSSKLSRGQRVVRTRSKLREIWNAPPNLRFTYHLNIESLEGANSRRYYPSVTESEETTPFVSTQGQKDKTIETPSNRFAELEDDDSEQKEGLYLFVITKSIVLPISWEK